MPVNLHPKLSVIVTAYNHEAYITECLESILMQKVDFEYELIIFDDGSVDQTRDIILTYRDKFNNLKLFFHKKNQGAHFTHITSMQKACGDYVILLDADDYWLDPNKLQKQMGILKQDTKKTLIGCTHNVQIYYEKKNNRENMLKKGEAKPTIDIHNLTSGYYFHTSSYLWRNVLNGLPKKYYFHKTLHGEVATAIFFAQYGNIHYIDEAMTCYRITGTGDHSRLTKMQQYLANLRLFYLIDKVLKREYPGPIKIQLYYADKTLKTLIQNKQYFSWQMLQTLLVTLAISSPAEYNLSHRVAGLMKDKTELKLPLWITHLWFYRLCWIGVLYGCRIIDPFRTYIFRFLYELSCGFYLNRYQTYYKAKIYEFFKVNLYQGVK